MKYKIFAILALCFFTCHANAADVVYVNMAGESKCTNRRAVSSTDWAMTCNGIEVRGLAQCSSYYFAIGHDDFVSIHGANDSISNAKYCWCTIIDPVLSYTISPNISTATTAADCLTNCSTWCLDKVEGNAVIMSGFNF